MRRPILPHFAVGLLFLLLLQSTLPAAAPERAIIDQELRAALATWKAPGMAVAIVRDDEVVYLQGVGVRELGNQEPITPDTVFGIGSCTKAFTATAIALLGEDGKASWDDPVRKHLPGFRLADPLADRDVTLRDLLCHRTGLARHDLLWYRAPWSVEESVHRLAHLEPAHSFRSAYEYNNLGYLAAGLAITSASGQPWPEFVRRRLFEPLGMKGGVFTRREAQKAADHATPHHRDAAGTVAPIPWYDDDKQVRASGSIKAGVRDLSRWVRMQLADGVVDGTRIVPARGLRETHAPQIVVPLDRELARETGATQVSYGLGWRITDYRGHALLEHGGAVDGFRARIVLLPDDNLGLVLLTNIDEADALAATGNILMDRLLGLPRKDWHAWYLERRKQAEASRRQAEQKQAASRRSGTKTSRDLDAYVGEYSEPAYGVVKVRLESGALELTWSSFRVPLRHFHYDTFLPALKDASHPLAGRFALFELNDAGDVATLRFLGRKFSRRTRRGER